MAWHAVFVVRHVSQRSESFCPCEKKGECFCPFGSVVEHSLGKGEVAGPIPAKGTSFYQDTS